MKTATLFRAYQKVESALQLNQAAQDFVEGLMGESSLVTNRMRELTARRARQRNKLAARILDDLADNGWTRVTDDPKTHPVRGITVLGAWVNGTNTRIVCASSWDGQRWCSDGPPSTFEGWRLYAWMEWPLAPPLPSVGQ